MTKANLETIHYEGSDRPAKITSDRDQSLYNQGFNEAIRMAEGFLAREGSPLANKISRLGGVPEFADAARRPYMRR